MSHSDDIPSSGPTPGPDPAPAPAKPAPPAPGAAAPAPRKPAAAADGKPAAPRRRRKPAPPPPKPGLGWAAWVAVAVLALDQLSKWIVVQLLNLKQVQAIDVLDPWLNLRMAWNQGVNFGLFSSDVEVMRLVLIAVALVICVWVAVWLVRVRPGRLAQIAAGLLIGGALGNVIDRMVYGAVADFLNMSLPDWRNPYSFNVADIAIFAGAIGLVLQPGPSSGAAGGKGKPAGKAQKPRTAAAKPKSDKTRDGARKTR